MTDYLRERFGQERIYLLGHFFGSYIGLLAALAVTEKYTAYLAMSQISDQPRSELLARDTLEAAYAAQGKTSMAEKLVQYRTETPDTAWLRRWFDAPERDTAMHAMGGGTMADMDSVVTGTFFPILRCTDYTPAQRIHIWQGKVFIQHTQVAYDRMSFVAADDVPALEIPVYFLAGPQDLTCCYATQVEYFDQIQAPLKGFCTFASSAHSPLFEEPAHMLELLSRDVLRDRTDLADPA